MQRIRKIAACQPKGIILREKDFSEEAYKALAENVMQICKQNDVPCILHSFIDAAILLGAEQIHLPLHILRGMEEEKKRQFRSIGASCHSVAEAQEAARLGCTYITAGHVFVTDCKKGLAPRGLAFLQEVVESVAIPVYAIGGTWQPDEGSIELDGVNVSGMPEYKRARYLGRVYQDPMMGTSAGMEIEENLALAVRRGKRHTLRLGIRRSEREDYRRRLKELGLGLEDRLTTKVGTLSGGQRQALTLLMATLQQPKLLLLDEHTAALDPQTAARVMELTDRLVQENHLTTLMITHNMRDAIRYGNRLLMLHNGRIVLDISGEEKARLTVADLMDMFRKVSGREYDNDRTLLA